MASEAGLAFLQSDEVDYEPPYCSSKKSNASKTNYFVKTCFYNFIRSFKRHSWKLKIHQNLGLYSLKINKIVWVTNVQHKEVRRKYLNEWIIWFLNLVLYYPLSARMCIVKGNSLTGNSCCTAKCSNTAFNIKWIKWKLDNRKM